MSLKKCAGDVLLNEDQTVGLIKQCKNSVATQKTVHVRSILEYRMVYMIGRKEEIFFIKIRNPCHLHDSDPEK